MVQHIDNTVQYSFLKHMQLMEYSTVQYVQSRNMCLCFYVFWNISSGKQIKFLLRTLEGMWNLLSILCCISWTFGTRSTTCLIGPKCQSWRSWQSFEGSCSKTIWESNPSSSSWCVLFVNAWVFSWIALQLVTVIKHGTSLALLR